MSNFEEALRNKISVLEDERQELEDALNRVGDKIRVLEELLCEEAEGKRPPVVPTKKKRGRPKGSKTKKNDPAAKDDVYEEATAALGDDVTPPELQKKLTSRYKPSPRPTEGLGPGVKAGTKKQVLGHADRPTDATISVEDGE
jgi:hypothetical protein